MCGGGGGNPISAGLNEIEKAGKGLHGEIDKAVGGATGGSTSTSSAGGKGSPGPLAGADFSNLKLDPPVIEAPAADLPEVETPKPPPAPTIKPPENKPPEVDVPEANVPTPPPVPSPNLNQDLTKGSTGAVQEAAIKAGSDVQAAAIKTGSDIQAGVTDITSKTGVKNETIEKIISSNVKGTEASIESNVQGTENTIQDFTKKVEEIGTVLTQPFQDQTGGGTQPPADQPPPEDYGVDTGNGDTLPDGAGLSPEALTAQEQKNRNRLLASSRYGRSKTILTGGSGLSSFGI